MSEFKTWHTDTLGAKTVDALRKNHFDAHYVRTGQEAIEKALSLISEGAVIGVGGSWTINTELGLSGLLEERGHTVLNHNKPGLSPEESLAIRRQQLSCDVFLSGSNAVTLDGKLVNVDGAGNRVAAMTFGPKKVIVIADMNKVVTDVAEAERRIQLYAAPLNNKRLSRTNPCTQSGYCMDCMSPTRICNITTIHRKKPAALDFHVILVGEPYGF